LATDRRSGGRVTEVTDLGSGSIDGEHREHREQKENIMDKITKFLFLQLSLSL